MISAVKSQENGSNETVVNAPAATNAATQLFLSALETYLDALAVLDRLCSNSQTYNDDRYKELLALNNSILAAGAGFESSVQDTGVIKAMQTYFRERTEPFASKSYLLDYARKWPRGFYGDFKLIECVYRNTPMSTGIGYYFDKHFINTTLSLAVQSRKNHLREQLKRALRDYPSPRVLNVACGSCREILESAIEINDADAHFTCFDFDPDAIAFVRDNLNHVDLSLDRIELRKYNALRMVNPSHTAKEFGPQEIIYSAGLFDYIEDKVLVRILGSLYQLLQPGGIFIAPFKDCARYRSQEYHWLARWDQFFQRTTDDMTELLRAAGIPDESISMERDATGVIVFFTINK